jgi:hypothetical protein
MKKTTPPLLKFCFALLLAMGPAVGVAQNIILNKYSFGEGLTFTGAGNSDYKITLSGMVQPFYEARFYSDSIIVDEPADRFRMRRLRMRLDGDAGRFSWRLQTEFTGNLEGEEATSNYLTDAWVGYNFAPRWSIKVGQKNVATDNRQLLIRSQTLQNVERSRVTSAFSTIREFGIFIDGTARLSESWYMRPSFVLSSGDGPNAFNANFGGFKYGGRVDFLPFGLFTNQGQFQEVDMMRELEPKLVFGVAYSFNDGMSSRRGRESGAILYLNENNEYSLPDFSKLGVDFLFKYRGFSALGEFVSTTATVPTDITQRVRNDGSITGDFDVNGVQDVENYVKSRMILGNAYNIQFGYLFKNLISVDARYTHLNANQYSFLNNGAFYNRPNYYTLGASKYFSKSYGIKIQAAVTYVEVLPGSTAHNGLPITGNEWLFQLITSIAF